MASRVHLVKSHHTSNSAGAGQPDLISMSMMAMPQVTNMHLCCLGKHVFVSAKMFAQCSNNELSVRESYVFVPFGHAYFLSAKMFKQGTSYFCGVVCVCAVAKIA